MNELSGIQWMLAMNFIFSGFIHCVYCVYYGGFVELVVVELWVSGWVCCGVSGGGVVGEWLGMLWFFVCIQWIQYVWLYGVVKYGMCECVLNQVSELCNFHEDYVWGLVVK